MKSESLIEQDKRDRLVAEWILKVATLEKLLLSKGLITQQELAESYMESVTHMNDFMKIVMAQKNENNKKN
ncbi:hypothetical protein LCGC14_0526180 [marine sediment metagenome]|uniref:Uncharacterized protein n=1 Tax=marine sediment metagenome TaxID=412755 RepID=A0A0F9V530_9ZZZZ